MTKIMVATPVYQTVHVEFCESLLRSQFALARQNLEMGWGRMVGLSARGGRNVLVAEFLSRPELSHMMWIDADLSWPPHAIGKLLTHDLPVVAGLYCTKTPELKWLCIPPGGGDQVHLRADGLFQVDGVAGGFVLVKREVYLAMVEAYPERHLYGSQEVPEHLRPWLFDLHPEDLVDGFVQSEDYGFCRLWRQLGGEIWVDPSIQLGHHGMHKFTADPMTMFVPAPRVVEAA